MPHFTPPPNFLRRVFQVTGKTPVAWETPAKSGGYSPALRLLVRFSDDTTAFVKAAVNDNTTLWLRDERRVYEALDGKPFLPAYYGFSDAENEADLPLLILEDLSPCHWPPPWSPVRVEAVLDALAHVRASLPVGPKDLPTTARLFPDEPGWQSIAHDPTLFLSLGLCSPAWFDAALPALLASEQASPFDGTDLLHLDVRSDNLCFRPDRGGALLVDWNMASVGNGLLDIACWLPSLCAEGGPRPDEMVPDAGVFAALLAGFWGYRAGQPPPIAAPRVRVVQKAQLAVVLPWAARVLGLPPPLPL